MSRTSLMLLLVISTCFLMSSCKGGCTNSKQQSIRQLPQSDPMVLILKNRSDSTSSSTAFQLAKSFNYTNIPFTTLDLDLLAEQNLTIPESVRLVCLTTPELEQMSDQSVEQLVRFVAGGNALFTTRPVWDQRFGYLLGIKPQIEYEQEPEADGFEFHQLAFPGFRDGSFNQPVPYHHRGFSENVFHDSVEVLASSNDSLDAPVIIENEIGLGKSVFFNSQIGYEKSYRGILFSLALKMLEGVAYPVANASTIFLDDFPAPLYDEKIPPIDWEYDITHAEFVTREWWPDMQELAEKYQIDYSAMITFNYNANVVPPFDFEEWTLSRINITGEYDRSSIGLAQQIAASRHELALHGYNHFSLWLRDWPNQEFMISALQAVRKRWRIDDLGPLPVTYVPPTNLIDSTGIQALAKGMPQVKYMSSLYNGDPAEGTGREFEPDPFEPSLFDYPRITSGFVNDDNSMFSQQSLYLLTGIWTHFVHPDDVFQVEQSQEDNFVSRNESGLGWHKNRELDYGLYEVFEDRIKETISNYPLIRFKAAKDAAPIARDWTQTQTYRTNTPEHRQIVYNLNSVQQQRNVSPDPGYWFVYVSENNRDQLEQVLSSQVEQLAFTPVWDGYLAQFSTNSDTLRIPHIYRSRRRQNTPAADLITNALSAYQIYRDRNEAYANEEDWTDTRLEDALEELNNNPESTALQDRVIDLAIEFDRLNLAISLLEKRLLTTDIWNTDDIQRLITYYGWADKTDRAWSLLEKLWQKLHDQSVIALKEMMVAQYGTSGMEFREKWLQRELELNPTDEQILTQLVQSTQSQERWPQAKSYLRKLITLNPASDTLYQYSLQRSLWYEEADSTVQWLDSFPPHAKEQLQPLSDQIAALYAYSLGNYDEALVWTEKSDSVSKQTRLQWLQQANRQEEFKERAEQEVASQTENDSLRAYVGTEFIYSGNSQLGYEILYPLFESNKASEEVKELVHTEIGYQPYEDKKEMYRRYPKFFTAEMADTLQHQYRTTEGVIGGLQGSYSSDNFGNTLAKIEMTAEWGYRQQGIHTVTAGQNLIHSDLNSNSLSDQLPRLNYTYQRSYRQQTMQSTFGAGLSLAEGEILPELSAGLGIAGDSTFTTGALSYSPVMTNTAINQNIEQFEGTLYREDHWFNKNRLMTTFSGTANWYTDEVFAYESLGRLYVQLPFTTSVARTRLIGEAAYSDATVNYTSGVPYWTPDGLFVKGGGLDIRYQDRMQDPDFWIEAEIMGKHNRDGFYLTSAARLNARIAKYWQLSLNAELSSSEVYRSNSAGFTVRYVFPKKLNPTR